MSGLLGILIVLLVIWVALHSKTTRSDGVLVPNLPPYRRLMGYIMTSSNSSIVYFDDYVDATELLRYIREANGKFEVDVTQCLIAAGINALCDTPSMNRFPSGRRLYQRKGRYITFSMMRKRLDRKAQLATVKVRLQPGETFKDLCDRIEEKIGVERSGKTTYADKEYGLLQNIPRPLLHFGVTCLRTLDYFNILPASFIENDAMFTSMFIANLGTLNMGAGYHHLYDWGNCPLFVMVGKIEDRPVVVDGEVVVRKTLHLRQTYDERIDDGFNARFGIDAMHRALADPFKYFGCLAEDGSDRRPLDSGAPEGPDGLPLPVSEVSGKAAA